MHIIAPYKALFFTENVWLFFFLISSLHKSIVGGYRPVRVFVLCWGFMAQSTQWGHLVGTHLNCMVKVLQMWPINMFSWKNKEAEGLLMRALFFFQEETRKISSWILLLSEIVESVRKLQWVHLLSQKHIYIILTPLNTTFFYSKTGVYSGIHYFSYFAKKHRLWVFVRTALSRQF